MYCGVPIATPICVSHALVEARTDVRLGMDALLVRSERGATSGRLSCRSSVFVLTAVAGYFALQANRVAAAAVVVAVLASLMVSYTRARAEALGVECKVGIATRPVRVVILAIGLIFARGASLGNFELLQPAVYVLAVLSVVTVVQRIWHVRRELSV